MDFRWIVGSVKELKDSSRAGVEKEKVKIRLMWERIHRSGIGGDEEEH
jgi:hypothetical protein